jgi:predicted Zn-dependent protease
VFRWTIGLLVGASLFAADAKLELRGRINSEVSDHWFQVTVFGVESTFRDSTPISPNGEFRFPSLTPGNYTIAVVGESSGEVRRTVVVSAANADRDGIVHTTVPFSRSEATVGGNSVVSVRQILIPKTAATWYASAQKHLSQHDAAGATHDLQQALRVDPGYSAAWNALGVVSAQSGNDTEAERDFRKALESEPGSFEPAINLGAILLKRGANQEALVYNLDAVKARPDDIQANAQLGMTYFQHGDFELAERYLIATKKLDPANFSQPQLFLAEIYRRRGDRLGVIRELQELLEYRSEGPSAEAIRRELRKLQSGD